MNVVQAKLVCAKLLRGMAKQDPKGGITVNGTRFGYIEAAQELEKMCEWIWPEYRTGNIKRVVQCKECVHFKRYKKKDSVRPMYKYKCSITKTERDPEFYCGDGKKKEE